MGKSAAIRKQDQNTMDPAAYAFAVAKLTTAVNELIDLLAEVRTFQTEVKTDIGTIATFQAALTAKLDADSGVGDTDYASSLTEVAAMTASAVSAVTAADPVSSSNLNLNGHKSYFIMSE